MNKTSSILSLVAVTALSAGIGASAAAPAQAAGSVWDRVAACESGGDWSISTGNGFYGGLQFTHSTWQAYGGGAYAYNANQASRAQQIAVAQKVLQSQGPGAWPVCSVRAGLTRSNGMGATGVTSSVRTVSLRTVTVKKTTTKHVVKKVTKKAPTTHTAVAVKGARYVSVKSGDSLSKIAAAHGTTWQKLWTLNKATIHNPNVIKVGQKIRIA